MSALKRYLAGRERRVRVAREVLDILRAEPYEEAVESGAIAP